MDTTRFLRYSIFTMLFCIPFIPLIVLNGTFFPFIVGKNFAFRIFVEIALGLWVALMLVDRSYRPKLSPVFWSVVAFAVAIFVADLFGMNFWKSFWSNFERMEGYITILHLFAYFVVASSVFNTEKLWHRFFNTNLAVSVLISIFGLFQLAGWFTINQGGVRLDGTFGNATYLAIYMVFNLFIAAWLMLSYKGKSLKWVRGIYGAIILLELVILFYTATRGAILGLIGGVFLSAILLALTMRGNPHIRKISYGTIIGLVVLVGGFMLIKNTSFVQHNEVLSRLATISLEGGQTRFEVWNTAWQGVKEHPIFGWGQENFIYVFNEHYNPNMYAQEAWFDRVHDVVLDWLIAGGLVGLIAYLSMFGAALFGLWFSKRSKDAFSPLERNLITGLFAGYFFHNIFVFDNILSYILFFSLLAFIHYRLTTKGLDPDLSDKRAKGTGLPAQVVLPVSLVLTVVIFYFANWNGIMTNVTLIKAISPAEGGVAQNLEYFKKAISYHGLGMQEVKEQLLQTGITVSRANGVDAKLKQDFLTYARTQMDEELVSNPNDARLQVFMGSFLSGAGSPEEALPYLQKAIEQSPSKQIILFELGQTQIQLGKYQDAVATFKKAYELAPAFQQAAVNYAAALIYAGNLDGASKILTPLFGTMAVNNDQLLAAYYASKHYDLVLQIWQARVASDPNNLQYHVSLAAAYLVSNRRADAISELQKAEALDATFKQQADYYISEIRAGRNP